MLITKEYINKIVPNHGRTSCSDNDISNGYGGWTGKYNRETGKKEIRHPRCNRCYLLNNIGIDTKDMEFKIITDVCLLYKGDK